MLHTGLRYLVGRRTKANLTNRIITKVAKVAQRMIESNRIKYFSLEASGKEK
jgi:hypothetical protein